MEPLCLGRCGATGASSARSRLKFPGAWHWGANDYWTEGLLSTGTAVHRWRQRYAELLREGIAATGSRSGGSGRRDPVSAGGPGTGVTFSTDCFIAVRRPKDDRRGRRAGRREPRAARSGRRAVKGCLSTIGGGWNSTEQDPGVQTGNPGGGTPCLLDLFVARGGRSEEHTSELQSLRQLVCRV